MTGVTQVPITRNNSPYIRLGGTSGARGGCSGGGGKFKWYIAIPIITISIPKCSIM